MSGKPKKDVVILAPSPEHWGEMHRQFGLSMGWTPEVAQKFGDWNKTFMIEVFGMLGKGIDKEDKK